MPEIRSAELITQEEINLLKKNPRQLSWKDIVPGKGVAMPFEFTELKSRYLISYTIDTIFIDEPNVKLEHVMVGARAFEPDPADMDEIARLILGDCFRPPAEWCLQRTMTHYLKIYGLNKKDMKCFCATGIQLGVAAINGKKNSIVRFKW